MHNHCIHVYVLFSTHSISTNYTYPIFFLYYSFFILFFVSFHLFLFLSFSSRPFLCPFVFVFNQAFSFSSCIYFHPFPFLCPLIFIFLHFLFFVLFPIILLLFFSYVLFCAQIYPHSFHHISLFYFINY